VSPALGLAAAIIHIHAYDNGGQQTFDWQVYARIIEGIRAQVDVSVYPSYPALTTASIGAGASQEESAERFAHIEALQRVPVTAEGPKSVIVNDEAHDSHFAPHRPSNCINAELRRGIRPPDRG
jgi:uncharacterized protein (DUF849 family)